MLDDEAGDNFVLLQFRCCPPDGEATISSALALIVGVLLLQCFSSGAHPNRSQISRLSGCTAYLLAIATRF